MTAIPKYETPVVAGSNFTSQWYKFLTSVATVTGTYNVTFQSGQVQYVGPNNQLTGTNNMIYGGLLPNPTGTPGPGLLLGSGPTPVTFTILQDQAFSPTVNGNNLIITSGETAGSGTANGGYVLVIGGGAFGGTGGTATFQGGTSANGTGGEAILAGGNATNGGKPGDAFVIGGAGMAPSQGANVHLIMTEANGISGVVRIRVNSTPLIDFYPDGSIFLYNGGGFGTAGQHLTSQGPGLPAIWS